jgi:uncharacterized damage-inducible protein DinB
MIGPGSLADLNCKDVEQVITMEIQEATPKELLAKLAEVTEQILAEVRNLDNEDINFNQDVNDWTIKQIMAHLRDAERIWTERVSRILAEDEPFLRAFNPDELAEERDYQQQDWNEVLGGFEQARQNNLTVFQSLNSAQWLKGGIHQERGRISIQDIAAELVAHSEEHLEQIRHVCWLAK